MRSFIYVPPFAIDTPLPGADALIITHGIPCPSGPLFFDPTDPTKTAACIKLNKFFSKEASQKQFFNDVAIGLLDRFFRACGYYQEKHVALPLGNDYYEFLLGLENWRPTEYLNTKDEENNFLTCFHGAGVNMDDDVEMGFDTGEYHNYIRLTHQFWGRIDNPSITTRPFLNFFSTNKALLFSHLTQDEFIFLQLFCLYKQNEDTPNSTLIEQLDSTAQLVLPSFLSEALRYQTSAIEFCMQSAGLIHHIPEPINPASTHPDPKYRLAFDLVEFETACRDHYSKHQAAFTDDLLAKKQSLSGEATSYSAPDSYSASRYAGRNNAHNAMTLFFRKKPDIELRSTLRKLVYEAVITQEVADNILERCNRQQDCTRNQEALEKFSGQLAALLNEPDIKAALRFSSDVSDKLLSMISPNCRIDRMRNALLGKYATDTASLKVSRE